MCFFFFLETELSQTASGSRLSRGFQICEAISDLVTLTDLILYFLVQKNSLTPTCIIFAKKFEFSFVCRDLLSELFLSIEASHVSALNISAFSITFI